jgi:hypothetical protein
MRAKWLLSGLALAAAALWAGASLGAPAWDAVPLGIPSSRIKAIFPGARAHELGLVLRHLSFAGHEVSVVFDIQAGALASIDVHFTEARRLTFKEDEDLLSRITDSLAQRYGPGDCGDHSGDVWIEYGCRWVAGDRRIYARVSGSDIARGPFDVVVSFAGREEP